LISREASIAKSRCTWNGEESPQIPIYSHHSSRWLTLGPHQARTMGSGHTPNNVELRYAERCTKPPRAQLQASARAQNHQKCSSGTFLPQLESVSKARPKGAAESLSPPWYRPGKVVLNGVVPAKSSWNMRFELVPPWSRPVMTSSDEIEQVFQPWLRPGDVETIQGHSASKVELDRAFQLVPPWSRPGDAALDRAVWLSFRAVWSRLRPRSSQYTAFTNPSFQTSRGRHAAHEIVSFNPYPSTTYSSKTLGSIEVSKSLERTGTNHLLYKLGEPEGEPPEAWLPKRGYPSVVSQRVSRPKCRHPKHERTEAPLPT
jgi:hypothetical protein